jgi:hypothetical protein
MVYALIPDDFTLKKITKAEKEAVDEYFGRERRGSYLEGLLSNPGTPGAIILIITGIIAKQLAEDFRIPEIQVKESIAKAADASNLFKGLPYAPSEDIVIEGLLKRLGLA